MNTPPIADRLMRFAEDMLEQIPERTPKPYVRIWARGLDNKFHAYRRSQYFPRIALLRCGLILNMEEIKSGEGMLLPRYRPVTMTGVREPDFDFENYCEECLDKEGLLEELRNGIPFFDRRQKVFVRG